MNVLCLLVATIFLLPSNPGYADQASDPNTNLLRAKDQALLDAIAPGDRKVWDDVLAANAVYVDENGGATKQDTEACHRLQPDDPAKHIIHRRHTIDQPTAVRMHDDEAAEDEKEVDGDIGIPHQAEPGM